MSKNLVLPLLNTSNNPIIAPSTPDTKSCSGVGYSNNPIPTENSMYPMNIPTAPN